MPAFSDAVAGVGLNCFPLKSWPIWEPYGQCSKENWVSRACGWRWGLASTAFPCDPENLLIATVWHWQRRSGLVLCRTISKSMASEQRKISSPSQAANCFQISPPLSGQFQNPESVVAQGPFSTCPILRVSLAHITTPRGLHSSFKCPKA